LKSGHAIVLVTNNSNGQEDADEDEGPVSWLTDTRLHTAVQQRTDIKGPHGTAPNPRDGHSANRLCVTARGRSLKQATMQAKREPEALMPVGARRLQGAGAFAGKACHVLQPPPRASLLHIPRKRSNQAAGTSGMLSPRGPLISGIRLDLNNTLSRAPDPAIDEGSRRRLEYAQLLNFLGGVFALAVQHGTEVSAHCRAKRTS
jgi:hypothetical protein